MHKKALQIIILLLNVNFVFGQTTSFDERILNNHLNRYQQRPISSLKYLEVKRLEISKLEEQTNAKNSLSAWFHRLFWFELNTAYSYRNNDLYVRYLNDYNILELFGSFGLRTSSINIDPYLFASTIYDVSSHKWNDVDWHNNFVLGVGLRRRFLVHQIANLNFREFWLDAFVERLWIHYFHNDTFFIGHRPRDDVKAGINFQTTFVTNDQGDAGSANRRIIHYLWIEAGGSIYFAKSSFYIRDRTRFYLIGLTGSIGPAWQFSSHAHIRPYAFFSLTHDLGKAAWNQLDWHNNFKFGVGAHLRFVRFKFYQVKKINFTISPYGELQWILYDEKVPYVPSYRPARDWRAGIYLALSN